MWYTNKRAIFEALKQFRIVYPDNNLTLLVTGIKKDDAEEYDKNFSSIIKEKFNISKIEYFYKEDYKWNSDPDKTRDDMIIYAHALLDKTIYMPSDDMDFVVNCSEDWFPFKKISINKNDQVSGRPREWDNWMNKELLSKFDYARTNNVVLWFAHGDFINLNIFKEKYTLENKEYITNILKEAYPLDMKLFADYIYSVWNTFIFDKFVDGKKDTFDLPSDINPELPEETFKRTDCYSRHGYKGYYHQPPSEEMIELGIKPYYE